MSSTIEPESRNHRFPHRNRTCNGFYSVTFFASERYFSISSIRYFSIDICAGDPYMYSYTRWRIYVDFVPLLLSLATSMWISLTIDASHVVRACQEDLCVVGNLSEIGLSQIDYRKSEIKQTSRTFFFRYQSPSFLSLFDTWFRIFISPIEYYFFMHV